MPNIFDRLAAKAGMGAYNKGKKLLERERYQEATRAFADAERLLRRRYGSSHTWVGQAMSNRAWCYLKMGRFAEALPLLEAALAVEVGYGDSDTLRARQLREGIEYATRMAYSDQ